MIHSRLRCRLFTILLLIVGRAVARCVPWGIAASPTRSLARDGVRRVMQRMEWNEIYSMH